MDIKPIASITCNKKKTIRQQFFSSSQRNWLFSSPLLMQSLCRTCFPLLDQTWIPSSWPLEHKLNVLVKPCWHHEKAHGTYGWPPMVTTGYFCHCNFITQSLNILSWIPKGSWSPSSGPEQAKITVYICEPWPSVTMNPAGMTHCLK